MERPYDSSSEPTRRWVTIPISKDEEDNREAIVEGRDGDTSGVGTGTPIPMVVRGARDRILDDRGEGSGARLGREIGRTDETVGEDRRLKRVERQE